VRARWHLAAQESGRAPLLLVERLHDLRRFAAMQFVLVVIALIACHNPY